MCAAASFRLGFFAYFFCLRKKVGAGQGLQKPLLNIRMARNGRRIMLLDFLASFFSKKNEEVVLGTLSPKLQRRSTPIALSNTIFKFVIET